jgi:hypothetical protein
VSNGKGCRCNAHCEHECCCDADWTTKEVYDLRAANARLTAEVAALKARDPLAEMWRELSEYQPQADRDGHGESWAKMCSERTGDWAWEAKLEARKASQDAAWAAADAVARALADATEWAVEVIEAIRRAKEVQP